MKVILSLLIGAFLSNVIGWTLGYTKNAYFIFSPLIVVVVPILVVAVIAIAIILYSASLTRKEELNESLKSV